jgi:phage tail-like protein
VPLNDTSKLGLANRFSVKIDAGEYDLGSWSHADGLEVSWDVAEYRAGDGGNQRWYFPGNTGYSRVKLTRSTCEDSKKVKKWLTETSFTWKPYTGRIVLYDSGGEEIMDWELARVMPVKWAVLAFDAGASRVATETLELAHLGFLHDDKTLGG